MQLRTLGTTGIEVSPIALGCWPIAGMSYPDVHDQQSLATLEACFELGINFLDTAYCYGTDGESERLIARALRGRRDRMVIATKGGIHWGPERKQQQDARPETLRRQCDESLRRLETDRVELYFLHAPDPEVPVEDSAGALRELMDAGKIRAAGVSNCSLAQTQQFASVCPLAAVQPPYNLLQREIEHGLLPWCREQQAAAVVYWPLMKGLLAGRFTREHRFPPGDGRAKYPMFQGAEWEKNLDLVETLKEIAAISGHTVAQLAINWVIEQEGVTAALVGAKRPDQIRENAAAADWSMTAEQRRALSDALSQRGAPVTRRAVQ